MPGPAGDGLQRGFSFFGTLFGRRDQRRPSAGRNRRGYPDSPSGLNLRCGSLTGRRLAGIDGWIVLVPYPVMVHGGRITLDLDGARIPVELAPGTASGTKIPLAGGEEARLVVEVPTP